MLPAPCAPVMLGAVMSTGERGLDWGEAERVGPESFPASLYCPPAPEGLSEEVGPCCRWPPGGSDERRLALSVWRRQRISLQLHQCLSWTLLMPSALKHIPSARGGN